MTCTRFLKQQTAEKRILILLVAFWLLVANNTGAATKPAVPLRVAYSSISGPPLCRGSPWTKDSSPNTISTLS